MPRLFWPLGSAATATCARSKEWPKRSNTANLRASQNNVSPWAPQPPPHTNIYTELEWQGKNKILYRLYFCARRCRWRMKGDEYCHRCLIQHPLQCPQQSQYILHLLQMITGNYFFLSRLFRAGSAAGRLFFLDKMHRETLFATEQVFPIQYALKKSFQKDIPHIARIECRRTWTSSNNASKVISTVAPPVHQIAALVPHAQFTAVRQGDGYRTRLFQKRHHAGIFFSNNALSYQQARRVRHSWGNIQSQETFFSVIWLWDRSGTQRTDLNL